MKSLLVFFSLLSGVFARDPDEYDVPSLPTCAMDADCELDEYCASGICRTMGTCDHTIDCFNPSNLYAKVLCVGVTECKNGACSVECGGSFCPNADEVNCFARPCDTSTCNQSHVACVDNYCGGCNAIFFDAAGHGVCTPASVKTKQESNENNAVKVESEMEQSCTRDGDCSAEHYCSRGICRAFGTCGNRADCLNPGNIYAAILCVGPLSCTNEGVCARTCSSSCDFSCDRYSGVSRLFCRIGAIIRRSFANC